MKAELSDTEALNLMLDILHNDGQPWETETIEYIAEVVERTGRRIPPMNEETW